MLKKLKIRFVIINMAIVTVMLTAVFSTLFFSTENRLRAQSMTYMQSFSENGKIKRPGEIPPPGQNNCFSVDISKDGKIIRISGYAAENYENEYLVGILDEIDTKNEPAGELESGNLRYFRKAAPFGQTVIFADTSAEKAVLGNLLKTCIIVGFSAFLVFFFISVMLSKLTVKPVEQAWEQQKQFVADASHELKTPLTVITTNAELLSSDEFSACEKEKFSENILNTAVQMRALVKNMLELARIDSGHHEEEMKALNLSIIAENAVLPFEPVFFENGISLKTDIEPEINVSGNGEQLKRVIDILLDNAQKYSSGGETELILKSISRSKCLLTVSNTGEPLKGDELENIFKRFYRGNKARTANGSYGLGLSIASEIIKKHHGKIYAVSSADKNYFCIELPLAAA